MQVVDSDLRAAIADHAGDRAGEALRTRREARPKGMKRPGAGKRSLRFLGYVSLCHSVSGQQL